MKYASYEEVREELSQARQDTLARYVRAANEEECDVFVVGGDLFERTGSIIRCNRFLVRGSHAPGPSVTRGAFSKRKQH